MFKLLHNEAIFLGENIFLIGRKITIRPKREDTHCQVSQSSVASSLFEQTLFRTKFVPDKICFEQTLFRTNFVSDKICFEQNGHAPTTLLHWKRRTPRRPERVHNAGSQQQHTQKTEDSSKKKQKKIYI
jgi:hypothetical protein